MLSAGLDRRKVLTTAQKAALARLRFEFGLEFRDSVARRPSVTVGIPDVSGGEARCDFFSRVAATMDTQHASIGAVIDNRPGKDFVFYERFELTAYRPRIIETALVPDSSGLHIPGTRVLPWRDLLKL